MKFSRKIVIFCISFIVAYTVLQIYMNYELSIELSPTLTTCVYSFFGTELALTAVLRIFDKEELLIKSKSKSTKKKTS